MLVLPPGAYGAANSAAGAASTSVRTECLLTSSLDGTLRLWDVSADLMSLEVCISAPRRRRRRRGGCGGVPGTKNYIAFGRSTWCSRVTAVATCPANVVENRETTGATNALVCSFRFCGGKIPREWGVGARVSFRCFGIFRSFSFTSSRLSYFLLSWFRRAQSRLQIRLKYIPWKKGGTIENR